MAGSKNLQLFQKKSALTRMMSRLTCIDSADVESHYVLAAQLTGNLAPTQEAEDKISTIQNKVKNYTNSDTFNEK
jgi:hypothetical protein